MKSRRERRLVRNRQRINSAISAVSHSACAGHDKVKSSFCLPRYAFADSPRGFQAELAIAY